MGWEGAALAPLGRRQKEARDPSRGMERTVLKFSSALNCWPTSHQGRAAVARDTFYSHHQQLSGKLRDGQSTQTMRGKAGCGLSPPCLYPAPEWGRLRAVDLLTSRLISLQRMLGLNMNPRMSLPEPHNSFLCNCGLPLLLGPLGQYELLPSSGL